MSEKEAEVRTPLVRPRHGLGREAMLLDGKDRLRRGARPGREPEVVRDEGPERDDVRALLEVEEEEREPVIKR